MASIARNEEIHPSNIFRWVENREALFLNVAQSTPRIANRSGARYPLLESELLKFVEAQRKLKLGVTKKMIMRKAIDIAPSFIHSELERNKFKASKSWAKKFMVRSGLTYRKATHVAQQKKRDLSHEQNEMVDYLRRLRRFLSEFPSLNVILQCDETPVYFDMVNPKTLDFIGSKTIDLITTGHEKTRFTVLLTIAADGFCLPAYVVFKGFKKVPKCPVPDNVIVNVNESGTMDRRLMIDYLRQVVFRYLYGRSGGLVMDSFRAHFVEEVVEYMTDINLKAMAIRPGYTAESQPLDVAVNKPFKGYMTEEWEYFMNEPVGESDFTKGGNRKKPSYERLMLMVSNSVNRLNQKPDLIKKVF